MIQNRFFRVGSKGILYNEQYYGTKASFNSYIEGFEKFQLEDEIHSEKDTATPITKNVQLPIPPPIALTSAPEITLPPTLLQPQSQHKAEKEMKNIPQKQSTNIGDRALGILQHLRKGNNLEKFLEAHGLSNCGVSAPQLKSAFDKFISSKSSPKHEEIIKWEQQIANLKELTDERKLAKWLESVGVPASNVSIPQVKSELEKYFENYPSGSQALQLPSKIDEPIWGNTKSAAKKHRKNHKLQRSHSLNDLRSQPQTKAAADARRLPKTKEWSSADDAEKIERKCRDFGPCPRLEDFKGKSLLYHENTLANKLWEDFKGMSAPKQVAVVVGITVVTAALGFVSWRILLLAFPTAFNVNPYFSEVLAQWFIQRQESTFHLFQHTAKNAKPLSTAWANQYLLWKYI